ncbi:MAG: tetratricopeptide repeat protein [Elusimicrobiota bacterium]|nr:tetratricopeptide repeat protein [Elusimicrobiota bacterium]
MNNEKNVGCPHSSNIMKIQKRPVAIFLFAALIIGAVIFFPKFKRTLRIHEIEKSIVQIITRTTDNKIDTFGTGFYISARGDIVLNSQIMLETSKIEITTPDNKTVIIKEVIAENQKYGFVISSTGVSSSNFLQPESDIATTKNEKIWAIGYRRQWTGINNNYVSLKKSWQIGKLVFGIARHRRIKFKSKPFVVERTIVEVTRNNSDDEIYKIKGFFPYSMQGCPVVNKWGTIIGLVDFAQYPNHIIPIKALTEVEYLGISPDQFAEMKKHSPEYFYEEGLRFFSGSYYNDALAYFQKTIALKQDFKDIYFQLARCYEEMIPQNRVENIENAIRTYKKVIKLNPDNAEAHYRLGKLLLWNSDEQKSSIEYFKKSIALKADFADAYLNLASAYSVTGDKNMALATLEKASHKFDNDIKILTKLGMTYTWCGKRELAIATLKKVIELKPDDIMAYSQLAAALSNNTTAEIKIYKKILQIDPENKIAVSNLAGCYAQLAAQTGKKKSYSRKAKKYYEKSNTAKSPSILNLCQSAEYYARVNDKKKALATINEAFRREPDSSMPYFYLGLISSKFGEYQNAIQAYKNSLRLKPEHIHKYARFNLIGSYLQTNNKDAAKKEYEILKKMDKKFASRLDNKFQQ